MSPGDRVEIDANLNKVSEIEHGFQDSKDVGRNSTFQADRSIKDKEKHLKLLRNYGAWLKSGKKNMFKNQTSKADISILC